MIVVFGLHYTIKYIYIHLNLTYIFTIFHGTLLFFYSSTFLLFFLFYTSKQTKQTTNKTELSAVVGERDILTAQLVRRGKKFL